MYEALRAMVRTVEEHENAVRERANALIARGSAVWAADALAAREEAQRHLEGYRTATDVEFGW